MTGSTSDVAYFSTIIAFMVVLTLHFMTFATVFIFDTYDILLFEMPKWQRYVIIGVFIVLPFYYLISRFFPESEILKQIERELNLKKGRLYAFGYVVFSIALFVITLLIVKDIIF
jgi:hypothetical protein